MRGNHEKPAAALFAPIGAPRKGSHEDVIFLRLSGESAKSAGEKTGYTPRHVQMITATFRERVLPRILQLSGDGFPPSTIADEVGLPETTVQLAIKRFGTKRAS